MDQSVTIPTMTAERFRACQALLGWKHRTVAKRLRIDTNAPRRWALGLEPVPAEIAAWLEQIVSVIEAHPAPRSTTPHASRRKTTISPSACQP